MQRLDLQTGTSTVAETSALKSAAPESPHSLEVAGQHLTIFVESPLLLDSMIADIQSATRRIWLETYIFFNDVGGSRVAAALAEKAKHGVDVRLLVDAVGSGTTPNSLFNELTIAGVKVHIFTAGRSPPFQTSKLF